MNKIKVIIPIIIICIGLVAFMGIFIDRARAQANNPGTVEDPLVTKSYVDQVNSNLLTQVQQMLDSNEQEAQPTQETQTTDMTAIYKYIDNHLAAVAAGEDIQVSSDSFKVVEVEAGQNLIGEDGTEMILRFGSVTAIANAAGDGLTDVTIGKDIKGGETVEVNHLLIIPRSDGRGLAVSQKSYVMVKGNYTVK